MIEAAPCFDAGEYHNSNIDRNFGNNLLNELNDNLSDFCLADINQDEDLDFEQQDGQDHYSFVKQNFTPIIKRKDEHQKYQKKKDQNFICTEVVGTDAKTGKPELCNKQFNERGNL